MRKIFIILCFFSSIAFGQNTKYFVKSNDTISLLIGAYSQMPLTNTKTIFYATDSLKWYYFNGSAHVSLNGQNGIKGDQGIQGIQGIAGTNGTNGLGAPVYALLSDGTTAMNFGTNTTVKVTPTATASYTTTVPAAGTECTLIILTTGTTSRTITFSTGFRAVSTLATGTTTAKIFTVRFISDGSTLIETGRTAAH
jgi:hypothetical protein